MTDYTNQTDVQKCELVSLSDLRTESSYVRGKLAGYLNDLLSVGVDDFRLDAAKHINAADIAAIQSQLTRSASSNRTASSGTGSTLSLNDTWR